MASLVFYGKPGCRTNRRQRRMLAELGHRLEVRDLLEESWTPARLRPFFGRRPVSQWFNRHAPQLVAGDINPHGLSEADALDLLVRDPILIRRPLIDSHVGRCAGFDRSPLLEYLGIRWSSADDPEACSRDAAVCLAGEGPP